MTTLSDIAKAVSAEFGVTRFRSVHMGARQKPSGYKTLSNPSTGEGKIPPQHPQENALFHMETRPISSENSAMENEQDSKESRCVPKIEGFVTVGDATARVLGRILSEGDLDRLPPDPRNPVAAE